MKSGVSWVSRKGVVRDANGEAGVRTGLATGRSLCDPHTARAASAVVAKRTPRALKALGRPAQQGGMVPVLDCRVIPGLAADDACVLIGQDAGADQGMAFQNLLQVVHHDLRDPLAAASQALQAACLGAGLGVEALCSRVDEPLLTLNKRVDLATGASQRRAAQGQVDTAQAQRSATDRAELMARASPAGPNAGRSHPARSCHETRSHRRRPSGHPQADSHDAGVRGLRSP